MIVRSILGILLCAFALPTFAVGDVNAGRSKAQVCAGCHGVDGNASIPNYPKLAGQHVSYLVRQLKAFKSGKRDNAIMKGQVANLSEQDMQNVAAYFNSQKTTLGAATDEKKRKLGERIYRGGNKSKAVPACMACHSPDGAGNPPAIFPKLSGQNAAYVVQSLKDYAAGKTRGIDPQDDKAKMMRDIAKRMSNDEMEAVAYYISALH